MHSWRTLLVFFLQCIRYVSISAPAACTIVLLGCNSVIDFYRASQSAARMSNMLMTRFSAGRIGEKQL